MESSSPEQQAGHDSRSARRRLIRGAFGAPAALTLYSGSVAAASFNCVQKRVANAVNPPSTTASTQDLYLRVQVKGKGSGDTASTWVSAADIALIASRAPAASFMGSTDWFCLTAGSTSTYTGLQVYSNADATAAARFGTPVPIDSYVAIRVNASGAIVGVTDQPSASAVAQSCWTSFLRTAP